jgi:hypothetical protein
MRGIGQLRPFIPLADQPFEWQLQSITRPWVVKATYGRTGLAEMIVSGPAAVSERPVRLAVVGIRCNADIPGIQSDIVARKDVIDRRLGARRQPKQCNGTAP